MLQKLTKDKVLLILIILTISIFIFSLLIGEIPIPWGNLSKLDFSSNDTFYKIVLQYRLPRTITAIFTGIALPISGWIMQEYFRNPLAGPSVLGISSMAGLGIAISIVLGGVFGFYGVYNAWYITISGLLGAIIGMLVLVWIAQLNFSTTALILIGFMLSAFSGSIVSILSYFATENELKSLVLWSFGTMTNLGLQKLIYFYIGIMVGLILVFRNIPSLVKIQLGEIYAMTMGVNVKLLRVQLILAASILTGICTAMVGPIAFIGLIVPHICRMYLKTSNFYKTFIHIIILGMLLMQLFTLICVIFPWGTLPINIVTSLVGTPLVFHIMLKNRKMWNV